MRAPLAVSDAPVSAPARIATRVAVVAASVDVNACRSKATCTSSPTADDDIRGGNETRQHAQSHPVHRQANERISLRRLEALGGGREHAASDGLREHHGQQGDPARVGEQRNRADDQAAGEEALDHDHELAAEQRRGEDGGGGREQARGRDRLARAGRGSARLHRQQGEGRELPGADGDCERRWASPRTGGRSRRLRVRSRCPTGRAGSRGRTAARL